MKSTCTLELEFPDEKTARNIAKALELDNEGYIETRVEGNIVYATTTADNVMAGSPAFRSASKPAWASDSREP